MAGRGSGLVGFSVFTHRWLAVALSVSQPLHRRDHGLPLKCEVALIPGAWLATEAGRIGGANRDHRRGRRPTQKIGAARQLEGQDRWGLTRLQPLQLVHCPSLPRQCAEAAWVSRRMTDLPKTTLRNDLRIVRPRAPRSRKVRMCRESCLMGGEPVVRGGRVPRPCGDLEVMAGRARSRTWSADGSVAACPGPARAPTPAATRAP